MRIAVCLISAWSVCGSAVKGLPVADYSSDNGFGYGGRVSLTGTRAGKPWALHMEYYATTAGVLQPMLEADMTLETGVRIRGKAMYDRTPYCGYYGYGNTDASTGYDSGFADDYGYVYRRTNPYAYLTAAVPAASVRGLAWLTGGGIAWYGIARSPQVPDDGSAPRLFADAPEGVAGGTLIRMLAGIAYDTRDVEYNAHRGSYAELTVEAGRLERLYSRVTAIAAFYSEPVGRWPRLVFAGRVLYDHLAGAPPFFVQEKTGGLDPEDAIGGAGTLRGIPRYRYKGDIKLVLTPELRCRLLSVGNVFHVENVLFVDAGNVWNRPGDIRPPLHVTWGLAPKLLWGEDFIVSAACGFWRRELSGTYINIGHQF